MKYIPLFVLLSICHLNYARNFTNHTIETGFGNYINGTVRTEKDLDWRPYWKNDCILVNDGEECHYKEDDFPIQITPGYQIPLRENTFWIMPTKKGIPILPGGTYTGKIKGGRIILLRMLEKNHDLASWWLDDVEDRIITEYDDQQYN